MTPNEPTARLGSKTVTESEMRASCANVGLPYPLPGGTNDGPDYQSIARRRDGRTGCRRIGRMRLPVDDCRSTDALSHRVAAGNAMRATQPAVEPLTVRDARRRERLHLAGQWALLFVAVGLLVGLVMGGAFGGGHWADHLGGGR